jgi:glycosyltransferase involved in cell wall biosynthesis
LLQHVASLVQSGHFSVDVAVPDVERISDRNRFNVEYTSAANTGAPIGLPNVRFRRFALDLDPSEQAREEARKIWSVQPAFERTLFLARRREFLTSGLAWGWSWPEGEPGKRCRWAMRDFGLHLGEEAHVELHATSNLPGALAVFDEQDEVVSHVPLSGQTVISFNAPAGAIRFQVTSASGYPDDVRPLGVFVNLIQVNGKPLDLAQATLLDQPFPDSVAAFDILDRAASSTRGDAGANLTASRGPHSAQLATFLHREVANYDLVITHNCVFGTAQLAVAAAKSAGVPVAVLPHVHLDDDFYHFNDVKACALDASAVLVAPQAACDFYRRQGARRVEYMTPGIDTSEAFTEADEAAFRSLWPHDTPFVLVLGRKAGAKGYRSIISAVETLSQRHRIAVVLIGPDDDGQPVVSDSATYLGAQPRHVLRGALRACLALVNMSSSESFGMVLLEAWLAGKPVVVNKHCAAFADLAEHGLNALTASPEDLADKLEMLVVRPELAHALGAEGRLTAERFDQRLVDERFVNICLSLCDPVLD